MASTFANALLTVVAAGGQHSEEGMFNELSTYGEKGNDQRIITLHTGLPSRSTYGEENDKQCTSIHAVSPGSTVRSTLHFVPSGMDTKDLWLRDHRFFGPLLSRAWCLQEDLLSTRKLYYASDQLYWECDHLAVSEDDLADPEFCSSVTASPSPSNIEESDLAHHASLDWYMDVISMNYSQRVATKATDRLIAVAGLARYVANMVKSRYLAGLWEVSVLQGLLWEVAGDRVQVFEAYCAPSWSWASRGVLTLWLSLGKGHKNFVPGCEYLRAHIALLGSDEYGGVTSGTLTLRSRVAEVVVVQELAAGIDLSASCEGVRGWAELDERMSPLGTAFLAVPILDDVSLLVTKISESHTYRRVGLWKIPSNIEYIYSRPALDTWDCPAEYLRWRDQILPTIPVTEITIV